MARMSLFFVCPMIAAREAVGLIDNPDVKVIDASTAHRTAEGWAFGFPELTPMQRGAIANAKRVVQPGLLAHRRHRAAPAVGGCGRHGCGLPGDCIGN